MSSKLVSELVSGLKSRDGESRRRALKELYRFATTDLRELPRDTLPSVLEEFNKEIVTLVSSYDNSDKRAGILTMVCLIGGDTETTKTSIIRFSQYLKSVFPDSDSSVLELAARTMGKVAATLGVNRAEYVENEIKQSIGWLGQGRNERLSAVLILKELAIAMPSYFYQQKLMVDFFNNIGSALRDPKEQIREAAAKALRAALVVTSQRENPKQISRAHWYNHCYEEAMTSFSDLNIREKHLSRDDHVHGALLILNELLRCSNSAWEKKYTALMQKLDAEQEIADEIASISTKSHPWHLHCYSYTDEEAQESLLYESSICRQLIQEKYEKICSEVMAQQISRAPLIHQMLLLMIPRLAAFNRETFAKKHLKSTINHLITFLEGKEKDKAMAFTTLGLIAVAVESDIDQYLSRILEVIKRSLCHRDASKKRHGCEAALYNCVTLVASALRDRADEVKPLLEPLCAPGLTLQLTTCLKELAQHLPALHKDITDRQLNMLSLILRNKPYAGARGGAGGAAGAGGGEAPSAAALVLALRTLGALDAAWQAGHAAFLRRCTQHYLLAEPAELRLEAARAAARLLGRAAAAAARQQPPERALLDLIDEAVGELLAAALADFDADVRCRALETFAEPALDAHLAREQHVAALFVAVNDESGEVRALATCAAARLARVNPSCVAARARELLVRLLADVRHAGLPRHEERAARALDCLVAHAPALARPYVDTILHVLVPKLHAHAAPGVLAGVLRTVGDVADGGGEGGALERWLPELLPPLVALLAGAQDAETRAVALWTLGRLVSATGYAVAPYAEHPRLLGALLAALGAARRARDRREAVRVLGTLGALDPYEHKVHRGLIDFQTQSLLIAAPEEAEVAAAGGAAEPCAAAAVAALLRVLEAPAPGPPREAVAALAVIFQALGTACVAHIPRVLPALLRLARDTPDDSFREFLFAQLARLVSVVKVHARTYLGRMLDLVREFWSPASRLQPTLILVVESAALALGGEFKPYLPKVLPALLRVLHEDASEGRAVTERLLRALPALRSNLEDVVQLVVPALTALFEPRAGTPPAVSRLALETVERLTLSLDLRPFSSAILQPLARVLEAWPALRAPAMCTLCALVVQLGRGYAAYATRMERLLARLRVQCPQYAVLAARLRLPSALAADDDALGDARARTTELQHHDQVVAPPTEPMRKLPVNVEALRRCWAVDGRLSKDDWDDWLRRLRARFLEESHSPAIRACAQLAQSCPALAGELFNVAFMSVWTELGDAPRRDLVASLEQALLAPDAPELVLTVLNLAEFMEHCAEGSLPISPKLLGERAISCRAYAIAIYYKEEEYRRNPTSQVVEALIHINNKLQQKEAANGLLETVMKQRARGDTSLSVHVRWYEKLHNWEQALRLYTKKLEAEPQDAESRLGQMRCLEALGEWSQLHAVTTEQWPSMGGDVKLKSAKMAAAASWGLQQWDSMRKYVELVPESSQDGAFYRAVLAIRAGQWAESRHLVDAARTLLAAELAAVAGESYPRAYPALVRAQLLAELEEAVLYTLVEERRRALRRAWRARLHAQQRVLGDWRRTLQVRSLVLAPREDAVTWLKFASLCRKSGALPEARRVLSAVLGSEPHASPELLLAAHEPRAVLAYAKTLWVSGEEPHAGRRLACELLQRCVDSAGRGGDEHCRLLARCHLKLGAWCEALNGVTERSIPDILRNYAAATALAPDWYKAWHAWAYMNYETVLHYKQQDNTSESSLTGSSCDKKHPRTDFVHQYVVKAVEGFFMSINLSNGNSLQDTLRLLTLWFEYGHHPAIYETLFEGVRKIEINIWLQVIPQLIARIDSPRPLVAKLVHSLLVDIGKFHPQALVYPLTVSSKSSFPARKTAANQILKTMCAHSQTLVAQAAIISEELIRVAILWHDQWFIALEEAARLYYSDEKDIKGMFKTLEPLHAMLERGPQTLKEHSFVQMYGRDLREAHDCCNRYKETSNDTHLNLAWDLYHGVFRRIMSQFRGLTSLELQYVSPRLLACRDLELAVPGSYAPGGDLIRIASIHTNLQVIKSKQHPRRLTIHGSDGKDYMFLLKGHEDLRQDERVMQLFGLVNTLLKSDVNTYRHDLAIQRYAVVPLSTNSGLIGWVPHCDTLYSLISDYREKKPNMLALNTEQQIMGRMASDPQKLTLMQKVEVFEYTLSQTPGNDLARLLWLKSPSAEAWFERRNNYMRSLAVMSMVGYILGLGDRHPSNIMLHRATGKVLHIDFGDCFEVTLTRDKYPEKIPFRLTRMLVNAMEVTGIEGTYRSTCESVMAVLHRHKDSVMAVLEAFVYDPLLNWRLVDTGRHSMSETSLCSTDPESPSTLPSRSRHHLHINESIEVPVELNQNKKALTIINRIRDKLTGRDMPCAGDAAVPTDTQVARLIQQATNNENLSQCFIGWCPFW